MKKVTLCLLVLFFGVGFAQTRITLGVFDPHDRTLERVLPLFQGYYRENHGHDIEVEMRVLGHGDHHDSLVTAFATGSGVPDVVALSVDYIARFITEGGLVDLSQEPFNADESRDLFVEYAWHQGRSFDDRQVAMPVDVAPGVMYFRREHLETTDTDADEIIASWENYLAYGRQLREHGIFLIADAQTVTEALIRADIPEGEGVYVGADGRPLLNSERHILAATVAQQVRQEGLDAQIDAWSNEWFEAFRRGTVATEFSGAWLAGYLQEWFPETAGLWGVSELPEGVLASWGGSFYAITQQSGNQEAAWELVKFLTTNEEAQLEAFQTIDAFPAIPATYDDPMFSEEIEFLGGQRARELYASIAERIQGVATHPMDILAAEIFATAITEILEEGRDVQGALDEAQALVERRVRR